MLYTVPVCPYRILILPGICKIRLLAAYYIWYYIRIYQVYFTININSKDIRYVQTFIIIPPPRLNSEEQARSTEHRQSKTSREWVHAAGRRHAPWWVQTSPQKGRRGGTQLFSSLISWKFLLAVCYTRIGARCRVPTWRGTSGRCQRRGLEGQTISIVDVCCCCCCCVVS